MATASLYVYNETDSPVNVSSASQNMQTAPPPAFTVQPGTPYTQDVTSIDQTSSFTLTTGSTHVLETTYSSDTGEYSIAPTSFDDGTVGALVAPMTISGNNVDVLNYLVGDGQPVTYLNGLLSALVPPAVAELNKTGPHTFTIDGISLELVTLDISSSNLSCTYASRQGTGASSFAMQAIVNLSAAKATVSSNGMNYQLSMTNLAALVFFTADTSALSLQVETMLFSFQGQVDGLGFPISETTLARALNSSPANQDLINKINETLKGGLAGGVPRASAQPSSETTAAAPTWAPQLATLLAQYGPA